MMMAVPAHPLDNTSKDSQPTLVEPMIAESSMVMPQPGISGINPITLLITMLVGAMMWVGIFYLGHLLLTAIF